MRDEVRDLLSAGYPGDVLIAVVDFDQVECHGLMMSLRIASFTRWSRDFRKAIDGRRNADRVVEGEVRAAAITEKALLPTEFGQVARPNVLAFSGPYDRSMIAADMLMIPAPNPIAVLPRPGLRLSKLRVPITKGLTMAAVLAGISAQILRAL